MWWSELFFSAFWLLAALWLMRRLRHFSLTDLPKSWLYAAFGLKILASLTLVALYTWYYTDTGKNDIYRLYNDSRVLYDLLFENPRTFLQIFFGDIDSNEAHAAILDSMNNWYSQGNALTGNNRNIIRLHVLYSVLSGGSFFARFIIHDFLVIAALLPLYRFFSEEAGIRRKELFAAVFLFPSVVFWTSGVFKEGLVLGGLGMLLYGSRKAFKLHEPLQGGLLLAGGTLLLLLTRPYMLFIAAFLLAVSYIRPNSCKAPFRKYAIISLLVLLLVGLADWAIPTFNPYRLLVEKQNSFIAHAQTENAGSLVYLPPLDSSPASALKTVPVGLFNSFVRPLFFDMRGITGLLASLENLFVLALLLASLFYYRKGNPQQSLIAFCLFLVLANHLIIGLSVPVTGAIVRYKTTTLPFLLCALSLAINSHTPFLRLFRSSP